jgi:cytochrome c1
MRGRINDREKEVAWRTLVLHGLPVQRAARRTDAFFQTYSPNLKLFRFSVLTDLQHAMHSRLLALCIIICFACGCDVKSGEIPKGSLADGDATSGKQLYQQHCSGCHGESGRGDGPGAKNINPKPVDHTNKQYMSALSDQHLFAVVRRGGKDVGRPAMPPFPNLSDNEIKDLIAYMRSISVQ